MTVQSWLKIEIKKIWSVNEKLHLIYLYIYFSCSFVCLYLVNGWTNPAKIEVNPLLLDISTGFQPMRVRES